MVMSFRWVAGEIRLRLWLGTTRYMQAAAGHREGWTDLFDGVGVVCQSPGSYKSARGFDLLK